MSYEYPFTSNKLQDHVDDISLAFLNNILGQDLDINIDKLAPLL